MNRHVIREHLKLEINFLKQLLSGNQFSNRELVSCATTQQKILLIEIWHEIVSGGIPIEKTRSKKVLKDKRKKVLSKLQKKFGSVAKAQKATERADDFTDILEEAADLYPYVLYYILHQKSEA